MNLKLQYKNNKKSPWVLQPFPHFLFSSLLNVKFRKKHDDDDDDKAHLTNRRYCAKIKYQRQIKWLGKIDFILYNISQHKIVKWK